MFSKCVLSLLRYTITTLTQLNLADNPLKPIAGVKLWQHGDDILRFNNTANKLLEVEPKAVRRMEPGTRIFDTTLYVLLGDICWVQYLF
jgi:hypothetical protein